MNNPESIMKVRNTDYLKWQTKIQQLEKENEFLRNKCVTEMVCKKCGDMLEKYEDNYCELCGDLLTEVSK